MNNAGLEPYIPQFRAAVLSHLNQIPDEEWEVYRSRGRAFEGDLRSVAESFVIEGDETRESLLHQAVAEDRAGPTIGEVIGMRRYKAHSTQIGEIEGQPVYYIDQAGVYIWAKTPESRMTLSFWTTFPAYPPGW